MALLRLPPFILRYGIKCFNTLSSSEVREAFFSYFKEHGHVYFPSSSLLPFDDPSLLFANAGMNQFKSIFLGTVDPDSKLGQLRRVFNSQKCLRAGGRTSDLSDVGRDTIHHSFFEMLGNWSFGDYYKKEACSYAWEFLTGRLGLSPARLYVTYFDGDDSLELKPDLETREIWRKIGIDDNRILPFKGKQNFWYMGESGPCGTCSEIHYNMESEKYMPLLVNQNGSSVVEIWNLVFLEYNRDTDGHIYHLPKHHVDCGLGFERICAIMQNVKSNYDTDIFQPLIDALSQFSKVGTYQWNRQNLDDERNMAFRIIVDHLRASCMAIADGATPGGTGRGFVLRQMLRRASLLSETKLRTERNVLSGLTPHFLEHLGKSYPEITKFARKISDVIGTEETKFWHLISKGRNLIEEYIALQPDIKIFPGDVSSHFWLSHGIPLDVQKLVLERKKLSINIAEFERCCEENRKKSLCSKKPDVKEEKLVTDVMNMIDKSEIPATNDLLKYVCSKTGGYYDLLPLGTVYAVINKAVQFVDELKPNEYGCIILSKTSFYAEEGGQACDTGVLYNMNKEAVFVVDSVFKRKGVVAHFGRCTERTIRTNISVEQRVDMSRRISLMKNHTATHLLLYALREIFGPVVIQKGSSVLPERLKLSCSVPKVLSMQQVFEVQNLVNKFIGSHKPVVVQELSFPDLLELNNLQSSLESYFAKAGPRSFHRVVSINGHAQSDKAYAIECCCGTHVHNTAEIGGFQIVSRKMTGAGICRFEAVTGDKADEALSSVHKIRSYINSLTPDSYEAELPFIKEEMHSRVLPCVAKEDLRKTLKKRLKLLKKGRTTV